jgi:hypothetical protein
MIIIQVKKSGFKTVQHDSQRENEAKKMKIGAWTDDCGFAGHSIPLSVAVLSEKKCLSIYTVLISVAVWSEEKCLSIHAVLISVAVLSEEKCLSIYTVVISVAVWSEGKCLSMYTVLILSVAVLSEGK